MTLGFVCRVCVCFSFIGVWMDNAMDAVPKKAMETILGKYEIRSRIATGPFSTIFEGWDTVHERTVAIKAVPLARSMARSTHGAPLGALTAEDTADQTISETSSLSVPETSDGDQPDILARFRLEAQAASRLSHANIVAIYDHGDNGAFAYLVMEYVQGMSLKTALDSGTRFSIESAAGVMRDILSALHYAHAEGVIHRDIKPANIMLDHTGAAKIADFGMSALRNGELSGDLTRGGASAGAGAYISPEQFRGEPLTASTDIYAAGIILYQLLTGERPFDGGLATIRRKVLNTNPARPSDLSLAVPRPADYVVAQATAKRPEERFRTAGQFLDTLNRALTSAPVIPAARDFTAVAPMLPPQRALNRTSARPAPQTPATVMRPPVDDKVATSAGAKRYFAAGAALSIVVAGGAFLVFRSMIEPHAIVAPPVASQSAMVADPAPTAAVAETVPVPAMPLPINLPAPAATQLTSAPIMPPMTLPPASSGVDTKVTDTTPNTVAPVTAAAQPATIGANAPAPTAVTALQSPPRIAEPAKEALAREALTKEALTREAPAVSAAPAAPASANLALRPPPQVVAILPGQAKPSPTILRPPPRPAMPAAVRRTVETSDDDLPTLDSELQAKLHNGATAARQSAAFNRDPQASPIGAQALASLPTVEPADTDPPPRPQTPYGTFEVRNGTRVFVPYRADN